MDATRGRAKTCPVCNKPVQTGPRVYCGAVCSQEGLRRKVKEQSAKRAKEAAERRAQVKPKPCRICDEKFMPKHALQIYCEKQVCKDTGLQLAIERQRQRREEAKAKNIES